MNNIYAIDVEPCRDAYRAIVLRFGRVVFTLRADTYDQAWNKAREWITDQTAEQPRRWPPKRQPGRYTKPKYQE